MKLKLKQIGIIHTPYKTSKEAPYQSSLSEEVCEIEVFKEYEGGLKDIEGFSHLIVLYWMHKSKGHSLLVKALWDTEPHGLFATRSPNRPNPIGISVMKLIKKKENILRVKSIDAIDGTPLIDIKPYIPKFDNRKNVRVGWLKGKL